MQQYNELQQQQCVAQEQYNRRYASSEGLANGQQYSAQYADPRFRGVEQFRRLEVRDVHISANLHAMCSAGVDKPVVSRVRNVWGAGDGVWCTCACL